jgi:chromosome segregation ATPase
VAGTGQSFNPNEFVTRDELANTLDSFRREIGSHAQIQRETRDELNKKLDSLLESKVEDAKDYGKLEQRVENIDRRTAEIATTLKAQGAAIASLSSNGPEKKLMKYVADIAKLVIAGLIGWWMKGGAAH